MNKTFTFNEIPENLTALQVLPEASLDTPFKAAALTMLSLLQFEKDPAAVYDMLEFLNGPDSLSGYAKQFLKERLSGTTYKPFSFFAGANQDNGYTPTKPFTITVSDNPTSYSDANFAVLYVKSSGADSPRPIRLRKKPSTGQWFINEIMCLSDIREPKSEDPWA